MCRRWLTPPLSVQPDGTCIVPDARAVVGEELHGRQTLVRGSGLIATAPLGGAAHGNTLGEERGTCCGTHRHDLLFLKRDGSVCALHPESTAGIDGCMVAGNPALLIFHHTPLTGTSTGYFVAVREQYDHKQCCTGVMLGHLDGAS